MIASQSSSQGGSLELELVFSYERSRTDPHHGVDHLSGVDPIVSGCVKGHFVSDSASSTEYKVDRSQGGRPISPSSSALAFLGARLTPEGGERWDLRRGWDPHYVRPAPGIRRKLKREVELI